MKQNLGEMLLAANLIDEVQMKVALAEQQRTGKKFGSTLIDLKFVDENVLAAFLARQIDVPCISLLNIDIPRKVLRRLNGIVARECKAIPIRMEGSRLEVAMADPTDGELLDKLAAMTGLTIVPRVAPQSSLEKMIDRCYPEHLVTEDDTMVVKPRSSAQENTAADPNFIDLIEEIENADLEHRLNRIETSLNEIWTLLERILRIIESPRPLRDDLAKHPENFTTR